MSFRYYIALLFFAFTLWTCSEKEVIIPEFTLPDSDRVVLVEKLTGVSCPNCPAGSAELERMKVEFGDNIAVVSIYTPFLGQPKPNSKYDFRTEFGIQIENQLGLYLGKPAASINRKLFPGEEYIPIANLGRWASYVLDELEEFSPIKIESNREYNSTTRELEIDFSILSNTQMEGDFRFTVYLVESGIIDPQENPGGVIDNYVHNNVLRAVLSSVNGDVLSSQISPSNPVNRSYTFTLPDEDGWWVAENCRVVAFVSERTDESTQVIQAHKFDLVD